MTFFAVRELAAGYRARNAIRDVSLSIRPGEIVAMIGHNGSGKSTVLKTIFGLLRARDGRIVFADEDITALSPPARMRLGLSFVPQGRALFAGLSVLANLRLGAFLRSRDIDDRLRRVFELFPVLGERKHQRAWSLSGGEQQMLALGRALMLDPKLLMLDEPSVGLAPVYVGHAFDTLRMISERAGMAILIAEQNIYQALRIADRVYVMKEGEVLLEDAPSNLRSRERLWGLF